MSTPYKDTVDLYDQIYTAKYDHAAIAAYVRELDRKHRARFTGRSSAWGNTLLDAGCGTGLPTQYLSKWYKVEGVDVNRHMITWRQGLGSLSLEARKVGIILKQRQRGPLAPCFYR